MSYTPLPRPLSHLIITTPRGKVIYYPHLINEETATHLMTKTEVDAVLCRSSFFRTDAALTEEPSRFPAWTKLFSIGAYFTAGWLPIHSKTLVPEFFFFNFAASFNQARLHEEQGTGECWHLGFLVGTVMNGFWGRQTWVQIRSHRSFTNHPLADFCLKWVISPLWFWVFSPVKWRQEPLPQRVSVVEMRTYTKCVGLGKAWWHVSSPFLPFHTPFLCQVNVTMQTSLLFFSGLFTCICAPLWWQWA